ncbi:MAG: kinase-like domain-containing protein [Benjaminiella poitrasii]|nr:MAG: kinase-like domain-containing protein [Benjaminiella poitrasii]
MLHSKTIGDRFISVFTLFVEEPSRHLVLTRFYEDFKEFDNRIKHYLGKWNASLPKLAVEQHTAVHQLDLSSITTTRKRKHTLRQRILDGFSSIRKKSITITTANSSNSDKIERYLRHCIDDLNIQSSTLFKDFLRPQREEDTVIWKKELLQAENCDNIQHRALSITHHPTTPPPEDNAMSVSSSLSSLQPQATRTIDSYSSSCFSDTPVTIQDFQLIKVIGRGCMGKVLLVRHRKTSKLLALKAISKRAVIEQSQVVHIKTEQQILADIASIHHPFLIKLHYSFQDMNQLFLVLDYHVGGDLATQLRIHHTLSPERCRFYTAEIVLGVQELHRLGILYRDLKPENILLTLNGHIVLTDFGLSKQFYDGLSLEEQRTDTFCGTAEYLAPEILNEQAYSYEVDYWSLGTILFEMLTGITPFWAENREEMYRRICQDPLQFPDFIDVETANFIAQLLKRDPNRRLGHGGLEGATKIRADPYFDPIDWHLTYTRRIQPPYVPHVCSETDFSLFDREFLLLTPRLSPVEDDPRLSQSLDRVFEGYSYTNRETCRHQLDSPPSELYPLSEPPPITLLDTMIDGQVDEENRTRYFVYNESDVIPYDEYTESMSNDDDIDVSDLVRHRVHHYPPRPSRPVTRRWTADEDLMAQVTSSNSDKSNSAISVSSSFIRY